jgi:hypothetical protein
MPRGGITLFGDGDEKIPSQRREGNPCPPRRGMIRRQRRHERAFANLSFGQPRPVRLAGESDESKIDPLVRQGLGLLRGGEIKQVHRYFRALSAEARHHLRRHAVKQSPHVTHRDLRLAGSRAASCCAHSEFALFEQRLGLVEESASGRRQPRPAPVPLQERHAEFGLERADLPAQGRLCHPQLPGGAGEVKRLRHSHEVAQLPEFHAPHHTGAA